MNFRKQKRFCAKPLTIVREYVHELLFLILNTTWKVSKYGVFFWSVFSRIRTEYGPEKTPYFDTFHTVKFIFAFCFSITISYLEYWRFIEMGQNLIPPYHFQPLRNIYTFICSTYPRFPARIFKHSTFTPLEISIWMSVWIWFLTDKFTDF